MGHPDYNMDINGEDFRDLLPGLEDLDEENIEFIEATSSHEEGASVTNEPPTNMPGARSVPVPFSARLNFAAVNNEEEVVENKSQNASRRCSRNELSFRRGENENREERNSSHSRRHEQGNTSSNRQRNIQNRRLRAIIRKSKRRQRLLKTFMWHTIHSLDIIKSLLDHHMKVIENVYQNC